MIYWVYIIKDGADRLTAGLSSELCNFLIRDHFHSVVYLRPFTIPIDAVAHKHLLDDLSLSSLWKLVRNNQEFTNMIMKTKA